LTVTSVQRLRKIDAWFRTPWSGKIALAFASACRQDVEVDNRASADWAAYAASPADRHASSRFSMRTGKFRTRLPVA
jgi:hypothetical protein